jgi:hypothetical protein
MESFILGARHTVVFVSLLSSCALALFLSGCERHDALYWCTQGPVVAGQVITVEGETSCLSCSTVHRTECDVVVDVNRIVVRGYVLATPGLLPCPPDCGSAFVECTSVVPLARREYVLTDGDNEDTFEVTDMPLEHDVCIEHRP